MIEAGSRHCSGLQLIPARVQCSLWSFPLNLPLPLLGIFNAQVMSSDDMDLPWSSELSHKVRYSTECFVSHSLAYRNATWVLPFGRGFCMYSLCWLLPFSACSGCLSAAAAYAYGCTPTVKCALPFSFPG